MKNIEITLTEEQQKQIAEQQMTLDQFLESVGGKESSIVEHSGDEAMKAVESDGDALRYVKEQTVDVCLKAVESDGDALRYVKRATFEAAKVVLVAGVKYALNKI